MKASCSIQKTRSLTAQGLLVAILIAAPAVAFSESLAVSGTEQIDAGVLQVKPVVEVDGSHDVMLDDLVEARGVTIEVVQLLRDVRLSDAPRAGETRYFSEAELSQTLRAHLRETMQKTGELPRFRIPSRVLVTRKTFKVKTDDVQKAIVAKFKAQCAECEFEFTRFSMPILPRNLDANSSWSLQTRPELPKGSFSIPIEIRSSARNTSNTGSNDSNGSGSEGSLFNGSGAVQTYWVSGQVVVRRQGAIASRAAAMGEKLSAEDFEVKLHDVTFSSDSPATAAEISNSILTRSVSAGEVIWRSQLRREMAVKNGDPVKVTAGSEEWQVTIDGIAQSSGYIGDSVRVKIPRTQKMVSGILRDKGVVELQ